MSEVARIQVRLTPRGGADRIDGVGPDGEMRVRVRAGPVEGAANEALCRLLARELDVPRSSISVERGATARLKRVRLEDVSGAVLRGRWPTLEVGGG